MLDDSELHENLRSNSRQTPCRILSYNIFMRPPGISSDKFGDLKNERLQSIISNILPNYDIICFQEMFTRLNCRREKLIEAAKSAGYQYFSIPPEQPFFSIYFINSGLLTISRHKITRTEFLPFHHGSGVDRLAYKGMMYSRIEVETGKFLNLFNVHLQAHYHHEDHGNIESRLNQISELPNYIQLCLRKYTDIDQGPDSDASFNEPIYIIGDFNVCANKHLFAREGYLKRSNTTNQFYNFIENSHPDDAHFSEYDYLIYVLRKQYEFCSGPNEIVDLLKVKYGYHPITFIESIHSPVNDADLHSMREHDSMDFIFQIIPPQQNQKQLMLQADPQSAQVQPFAVKDAKFSFMSDHLGVEFLLKPQEQTLR